MHAVVYDRFGKPGEVVKCVDRPVPKPQPNEIRVRLLLSPIHNHDILTIRGDYGNRPPLPAIGGTEALGIVDALGADARHLQPGQRVVIARAPGAWAELFTAPARFVVPIDRNIPDELAAQMSSMPFSAGLALNELQAQPGDWVAVNAANGAVGKALAQIAIGRGLNVIGIVRSQFSRRVLDELGLDHVYVSDEPHWKDQVAKDVGDGRIAGAVDMVGGAASGDLLSLLSRRGTLLSFGAMDDARLQFSVSDLIYKETVVRGFWASRLVERITPQEAGALSAELAQLAAAGQLHLPVAGRFPLSEATAAMRAYYEPRAGKLLFHP
ncbi:MAG: zinc-binding dehydrogenase [Planctomycetaceae bacterium]